MKVLVTGGAGYIGSHTCKALAQAGHEPVVYDNLCTGHRELVRWGGFAYGDILDTPHLAQIMKRQGIEGVIHFAALSTVGESVAEPGRYYRNNVAGTLSILEAMRLADVERIVVSSTCAVYGVPAVVPIEESTPHAPINPYGVTKATMEAMLRDFYHAHGIRSAALRYFNAAGADVDGETGEWHDPETHLVPRVLMAASGAIPALEIFGKDYPTPDGTCIRDYIHVADLADAHVRALAFLGERSEALALNLGTGTGYSVRQILDAAADVLGKPAPYRFGPRRPGDPPLLVAKADGARETLGWAPRHSDLRHILATAAAWHERKR